jgi:hypothetical protein
VSTYLYLDYKLTAVGYLGILFLNIDTTVWIQKEDGHNKLANLTEIAADISVKYVISFTALLGMVLISLIGSKVVWEDVCDFISSVKKQ